MINFNADLYMDRRFNLVNNNCWHLVKDVWLELTGVDLEDFTPQTPTKTSCWVATTEAQSRFRELSEPESPCIVLMQRAIDIPHIGVYIDGKLLHLRPTGTIWQPLEIARIGFPVLLYYTNKG